MPDIPISETKDEWQEKIALDLSAHKGKQETLVNPEIVIIFPRIEEGRPGFHLTPMEERKTAKLIFDNISQKISETVIAQARLNTVNKLAQHNTIMKAASVLSNPYECWGNLFE